MTLSEFDKIRQYLPPDTQIEVITTPESKQIVPMDDEVWAISICDWGNHDGRFNVMCANCGDIYESDFPRALRNKMAATHSGKPCPKCGKTFIKRKDIKR